jgi:hypothetical protein
MHTRAHECPAHPTGHPAYACTADLAPDGVMTGTCADTLDGGGWVLVRHLPIGSAHWHPVNDNLAGTIAYGSPSADKSAAEWGVKWNSMNFDQFLFATVDCTDWLIATPAAVGTNPVDNYEEESRPIVASACNNADCNTPVVWRNGLTNGAWPWIKIDSTSTIYLENGGKPPRLLTLLEPRGANVYIRKEECKTCGAGAYRVCVVTHTHILARIHTHARMRVHA